MFGPFHMMGSNLRQLMGFWVTLFLFEFGIL